MSILKYKIMSIEVECPNHELVFVKSRLDNGVIQIRKQCFLCGMVENRNYKHSNFENIDDLPELSKEMRESYYSKLNKLYSENKKRDYDIEREKMKREYELYLSSYEWKRKHDYIMKKYGHRCILCFNPAVNVHHLTYKRIYLEDERDLVALCKNCHEFVHDISTDSNIL